MSDNIDVETALRASLAARARHTPAADLLAERIIAGASAGIGAGVGLVPLRERPRARQWRTWTLPLVAAGAVAAVAAALVGINQFGHTAGHKPAVPLSAGPATPTPTLRPTSAATSPSPPGPSGSPAAGSPTRPVPELGPVPVNFTVFDLTFASADEGWSLGSGRCLSGSGLCTSLIRTTDGGQTWHGVRPPPANVTGVHGCADPCVWHVRFATDQIGYAFGPAAFFLTTDGGRNWRRGPGGADALETLDGNAIRVAARNGCSPPGCVYGVQTAQIGSGTWHDVGLSAATSGTSVGVALARTGRRAFLEVFGHTAGGGPDARSALYTSGDDGANWTSRGEPCPQRGVETDSTAIAAANDGSVTVLCRPRGGQRPQFTSTSTDGARSFRPGNPTLGVGTVAALGAASSTVLLVASDDTYRSADGGVTFRRLGANGGSSPGPANWIGFESPTVGRAVSDAGQAIWTTRDAGLTWTPHAFR